MGLSNFFAPENVFYSLCRFQMPSPKPTVVSSPVYKDQHSPPPPASSIVDSVVAPPPAKAPSPAPPATEALTTDTLKLEDLETELELDLENMKLDNIDTTVTVFAFAANVRTGIVDL